MKLEMKRGDWNSIPRILPHPSLLYFFLTKGRKGAIRQVMKISGNQLSQVSQLDFNSYLKEGKGISLLGQVQGIGQEFLYFLVRQCKPRVVVETGVFRGVSSSLILNAMRDNNVGKLYSIDLPNAKYIEDDGTIGYSPLSAKEETGSAISDNLKSRWELILGDSKAELPMLLKRLGTIDMFHHDSEHTYKNMMWEYETVYPYLSSKSILSSDDVKWNSAFFDFCNSHHLTATAIEERAGFSLVNKEA